MDLLSDLPRIKKEQPLPIDPDEVERRLAQEAINEVLGIDGVAAVVETENNTASLKDITPGDPSLQRDYMEKITTVGPSTISIQEVIPSDLDLNNLNRADAFGEATPDEIAEAGLFSGSIGRPLYESLKNRETMADISRRVAQSMTPLNLEVPAIINNSLFDLPAIPVTPRSIIDVSIAPVESINQELLNQAPIVPLNLAPNVIFDEGNFQTAVADQFTLQPRYLVRLSRREIFEQATGENEEQVQGKSKRRRRRRVRRSASLEYHKLLELNGPLIRHNRKSNPASNVSKPVVQPHIMMNIFENLDDYEPDEVLDNLEEDIEVNAVNFPNEIMKENLCPLPEIQRQSTNQLMVPDPPETMCPSKESFVPKRRRIENSDVLREILGFDENAQPPKNSIQNIESSFHTPIANFKPPKVSTVNIQKITMEDIDFGRLRNISETNLHLSRSLDAEAIAGFFGRSKSGVVGEVEAFRGGRDGTLLNIPHQIEKSPTMRQYAKDGENWFAYEGVRGRTERYTEYNLEVKFKLSPFIFH